MNVKEMAEVYRIGLQIGIFSKADIINWADQTIEKLDHPSNEIIEVSLSSNDKLVDYSLYFRNAPLNLILPIFTYFTLCLS
ncbi:hypothetical protein K4569_23940 [Bacillus bingmayongensis]|nr:hypothetical protein [Bacillus bingmayongensis]MBY0599280.1 hypothetical protein [Bacillus bingmayongensis]